MGSLYNRICEPDNLRLAFLKAARGKADRREVSAFRANLDDNLAVMRTRLLSGDVTFGNYRFFRIFDPKERNICAASFDERVIHHAFMNVLEPAFEKYAVYDTYACRPGKGLHKALLRAQGYARQFAWYLKLDIRKYYASIDHELLLKMLRKLIRDKRVLQALEKNCRVYQATPDCGLPVGSLLSQHFANLYLGLMDHWLKEQRHIKGYVRYMDDFLLFDEDKGQLKTELAEVQGFLASRLKLELKNSTQLNRCGQGVPFLGFRIFPEKVLLSRRSRVRFAKKLAEYEQAAAEGRLSEMELSRRISAMVSFTQAADSTGFRRAVIRSEGVLFDKEPTAFFAAGAGTTMRGTVGSPTGTTTTPAIGTTTLVSGLRSQLTAGWMPRTEQNSILSPLFRGEDCRTPVGSYSTVMQTPRVL